MLSPVQISVFLLMLDAAWVAFGLARKKNMWKWIVLYWLILTASNALRLAGLD